MGCSTEQADKFIFINQVVTVKLSSLLKQHGVHAILVITSGKQMSNSYTSCLNRVDFVAILSYIELLWSWNVSMVSEIRYIKAAVDKGNYIGTLLKWLYLGSYLFSDKVSHRYKHLCKIACSNYIWFLSYVKVEFWWWLYTSRSRRRTNGPLFTAFSRQQWSTISLIDVV